MEGFKELMQQAHGGDKGARDTLIAGNLGLVHTIANRFEHRGHEREELFQIGCIGLMKAVDKFDLSLNLFHLCSSGDHGGNPQIFKR